MNEAHSQPLVSVIVRTMDRPGLLAQALRSVAAQTYPAIEVVVVNDGGADVGAVITAASSLLPRLHYHILSENRGRGAAANQGITTATGEWIAFLDDDDLYYPDAIAALVEAARQHDSPVVYGRVVLKHFHPDETPDTDNPDRHFAYPFDRDVLRVENYIPFNALLFNKAVFTQCGLLREDLPLCEDWEFLLRITDQLTPVFIDHAVAVYRSFGDATVSGRRFSPEVLAAAMDTVMQARWGTVTPAVIRAYQQMNAGRFEWTQRELVTENRQLERYLRHAETEREALAREVDNLRGFLADADAERKALAREVDNLRGFLGHCEQELAWIRAHKSVDLYLKLRRRMGDQPS